MPILRLLGLSRTDEERLAAVRDRVVVRERYRTWAGWRVFAHLTVVLLVPLLFPPLLVGAAEVHLSFGFGALAGAIVGIHVLPLWFWLAGAVRECEEARLFLAAHDTLARIPAVYDSIRPHLEPPPRRWFDSPRTARTGEELVSGLRRSQEWFKRWGIATTFLVALFFGTILPGVISSILGVGEALAKQMGQPQSVVLLYLGSLTGAVVAGGLTISGKKALETLCLTLWNDGHFDGSLLKLHAVSRQIRTNGAPLAERSADLLDGSFGSAWESRRGHPST